MRSFLTICVTLNTDPYGCRILTSAEVDQAIRTQRVIAAGSAVGNAIAIAVVTNRANKAVQRHAGNVNLSGVVAALPNNEYLHAEEVNVPGQKTWSVPAEQIWSFIPFANMPATLEPGTYSIQKALTNINLILSNDGAGTSRLYHSLHHYANQGFFPLIVSYRKGPRRD